VLFAIGHKSAFVPKLPGIPRKQRDLPAGAAAELEPPRALPEPPPARKGRGPGFPSRRSEESQRWPRSWRATVLLLSGDERRLLDVVEH
jgi:hypothetical protein